MQSNKDSILQSTLLGAGHYIKTARPHIKTNNGHDLPDSLFYVNLRLNRKFA